MISIKGIDNGYTKNHFFEFSSGEVSIRNLVSDEVKHVHKYIPYEFLNSVRKTIISSILERGVRVENCSISDMILERHPVSLFPESKIKSLQEKYFSIPVEFLSYYPNNSIKLITPLLENGENSTPVDETESLKRKRIGRPSMEKELKVIKEIYADHASKHYPILIIFYTLAG